MTVDRVVLPDVLQALAAQLAWFQAALLGAAAVHKMSRWSFTQGVARRFVGVSAGRAARASTAAVAVELSTALALLVPGTRAAGAVIAAVLWSVYLAFIWRAIRSNRRDVDCGCTFGSGHRPLGAFQLARNAVLVIVATAVAGISQWSGGAASVVQTSQALAAFALLALYVALDQVMALGPLRSGDVL